MLQIYKIFLNYVLFKRKFVTLHHQMNQKNETTTIRTHHDQIGRAHV